MKKLSLLSALFGLMFFGGASAADITIYYSPYCPHCHHAQEFFANNMIYEYPKLKVVQVNVMEEDKLPVFQEALAKCKYDNGGVPVIVVGDKCFQGYADFMQQELRDAVEADLSDSDKAEAAKNRKEMEKDIEGFKTRYAKRREAIKEYNPNAVVQENVKKNNNGSPIYFYVLLVALVAIFGVVLLKKDKNNKK